MRRTEYLITELRNSTDNRNTNAVKDAEIISYLNYAQKLIQNIIFKNNPDARFFNKSVEYSYSASGEYDLPDDVLAKNAIQKVEYKNGTRYAPIDLINSAESGRSGYYVEDSKVIIQGYASLDVKITYFKALPRMDKRWGKVSAISSGVSLTLTGADSDLSTLDDYVTVVDKNGTQIRDGIFVDSYALPILATTDALTSITTDHYVCSGKNSVGVSELPDECEPYLLDYARQRIYTRNVYEDASKQVFFTDKQEADISSLFSNNQKDFITLPITDYDAMDF
jgi:hypothetical protein